MIRVVVLLFAICMFTSYVVHSQLQQTRKIAPGSKAIVLAEEPSLGSKETTDLQARTNSPAVAIITAPPLAESTKRPVFRKAPAEIYFPGSKSGRMFTFESPGNNPFLDSSNLAFLPDPSVDFISPSNWVSEPYAVKPGGVIHPTIESPAIKKKVAISSGQ